MTTEEARLFLQAKAPDADIPPDKLSSAPTWAHTGARPAHGRFPLVLLSPGLAFPRATLTGLANVGLAELYEFMDTAIDEQFGPDQFVTAQMARLDIASGYLEWVNAGHPAPLLIRGNRVIEALEGAGTLPVGFGGAAPQINTRQLVRHDRVLFYTDGLIEEHETGGEQFGEERLINSIEHVGPMTKSVQQMARSLSHALMRERKGMTSDDASLFLVEWCGGTADHLAEIDL
ncbi:PP2C family protein-serine/threonine phosphatase [Nonomuraea sp. NPDC049784]|uniref:PP2C family protein-serine/threonine phosphatase n=1 Tax=Nonomuraea sp. NPDC049784 TaxID=3154361 RepID=UPI0033FDCB79